MQQLITESKVRVDTSSLIKTLRHVFIVLLLFTCVVRAECQGSGLTFTSIAPAAAQAGTPLVLSGTGFGATQGTSNVYYLYGNQQWIVLTPSSWSDTAITVALPTAATSGYITISNPGTGYAATLPFTVLIPPRLDAISPTSGAASSTVQINGSGFGAAKGVLTLNGTVSSTSKWTDTSISATVPGGATSGAVTVTTSDGLSTTGLSFTVLPVPHISSITPSSSPEYAPVAISGVNFGSTTGEVSFRGIIATPISWSPTSINVTVPAGARTGGVIVKAEGISSNAYRFGVGIAPVITMSTPSSAGVGSSVTLQGSGFETAQGTSAVTFNRSPAVITSWSDSTIVAQVPNGASSGPIFVYVGSLRSNPLAFTVTSAPNLTGTLNMIIRDEGTRLGIVGASLAGASIASGPPTSLQNYGNSDSNASINLQLAPGQYAFEVTANGYSPARTTATVDPQIPVQISTFLVSTVPDPSLQAAVASYNSSQHIIYGYAMDAGTHAPLVGVNVALQSSQISTVSDSYGFFRLQVAAGSGVATQDANGEPIMAETLMSSANGYSPYSVTNIETDANSGTQLTLELSPSGTTADVVSAGLQPDGENHQEDVATTTALSEDIQNWLSSVPQNTAALTNEVAPASISGSLPGTIRVGTDCELVSDTPNRKSIRCSSSEVHTLEDYVAVGLGGEWKPVWSADSLKAGAVAYRSYGAYYVSHPMGKNFDICNVDLCQVYDPSRFRPETRAAALATTGTYLSADGNTSARTEYASETNVALCGKSPNKTRCCSDGMTGDGSSAWPCMPDALGAGVLPLIISPTGATESVHGRGMSQRGSQRWAGGLNASRAKVTMTTPWQCILDHYYNDSGNSTGSQARGGRKLFIAGKGGDGLIVYATSTGLVASGLDGSNPHQVTTSPSSTPTWSPDFKSIGYQNSLTADIIITSVDGSTSRTILAGDDSAGEPNWSPMGNQVIIDANSYELSFDPNTGQGVAFWADSLRMSTGTLRSPAFSPDGSRIAISVINPDIPSGIYGSWLGIGDSSDGGVWLTQPQALAVPNYFFNPAWSPDGKTLVFDGCQACFQGLSQPPAIFLEPSAGGAVSQLTGTSFAAPQYSQDGRSIFYTSVDQNFNTVLYVMNVDGSNQHAVSGIPAFGGSGVAVALAGFTAKPYAVTACRRFDTYVQTMQ